jgi:hypothetical protein
MPDFQNYDPLSYDPLAFDPLADHQGYSEDFWSGVRPVAVINGAPPAIRPVRIERPVAGIDMDRAATYGPSYKVEF